MSKNKPKSPDEIGAAALLHLEEALKLLDELGAPGEIGAYVDLAIHRLKGGNSPLAKGLREPIR